MQSPLLIDTSFDQLISDLSRASKMQRVSVGVRGHTLILMHTDQSYQPFKLVGGQKRMGQKSKLCHVKVKDTLFSFLSHVKD